MAFSQEDARTVWSAVQGHRDADGDTLSDMFMKLPSRKEYPDYYEVIPEPMDLRTVKQRIDKKAYKTMSEFEDDMNAIFENAKFYNEPGSQVHKDAVTLQKLFRGKVKALARAASPSAEATTPAQATAAGASPKRRQAPPPASPAAVAASPPPASSGKRERKPKAVPSDFEVESPVPAKKAKKAADGDAAPPGESSSTPARASKKALSSEQTSDEASSTPTGKSKKKAPGLPATPKLVLRSPQPEPAPTTPKLVLKAALSTPLTIPTNTPRARAGRGARDASPPSSPTPAPTKPAQKEVPAEPAPAEPTDAPPRDLTHVTYSDSLRNPKTKARYSVGDYVYVDPGRAAAATGGKPSIVQIHQCFTDKKRKESGIVGARFIHQEQTFHVPTRRFYEREVFKLAQLQEFLLDDIMGKCVVLFVRDFSKGHPIGFDAKDVYVCESRYNEKMREIQPIKNWRVGMPQQWQTDNMDHPPLEPHAQPVTLHKTVQSVFHDEAMAAAAAAKEAKEAKAVREAAEISLKRKREDVSPAAPSKQARTDAPAPPIRINTAPAVSSPASSAAPAARERSASPQPAPGVPHWTLAETLQLVCAVQQHGVGHWEAILRDPQFDFGSRPNASGFNLRERWNTLQRRLEGGPTVAELLDALQSGISDRAYMNYIAMRREAKEAGDTYNARGLHFLKSKRHLFRNFYVCPRRECDRVGFASLSELISHIRNGHYVPLGHVTPIEPAAPVPPVAPPAAEPSRPLAASALLSGSMASGAPLQPIASPAVAAAPTLAVPPPPLPLPQPPPPPLPLPQLPVLPLTVSATVPGKGSLLADPPLPRDMVAAYASTVDGRLLWYPTPPLDVPKRAAPTPSEAFLRWREQSKNSVSEVDRRMEEAIERARQRLLPGHVSVEAMAASAVQAFGPALAATESL